MHQTISLQDAALINGASGHVLEIDDSDRTGLSHPGVMVITPALITAAVENKSGKDLIAACVAGYEIMLRIGTALGLDHYSIWHTTSTTGPLGSVISAGKLLNLTRKELTNAFGNAGTLACGLWEFNKTHAMSKLLHTGIGGAHGILSARLAKNGFTGAQDILEGTQGLFAGFPSKDLDLSVFDDFYKFWRTDGVSFKPYPCCRHTHGGADCGLALHQLIDRQELNQISSIIIETYQAAYQVVGSNKCSTPKQAKFSLPYLVCTGLLYGYVDNRNFEEIYVNESTIQSLLQKTEILVATDIQKIHPYHEQCRVTVRFTNGIEKQVFVPDPLGEPENPMLWEQLILKGKGLLAPRCDSWKIDSLEQMIQDLENVSIKEVYSLIHSMTISS